MKAQVLPPPLLDAYAEARAPRYTSYPTALQFTDAVKASTYRSWLSELPGEAPVSLYIHVPFCKRLCWYCGCNTRVIQRADTVSDYVQMLDREIELLFWARGGILSVASLHLGGGSPDSLSPQDLDRLFASLRYAFYLPKGIEIAAELDPAHVTGEWIRAAARHGLNRASLGVQTFDPAVQAAVNRLQSYPQVAEVVSALREAGVKGVNFDLMYGLPKQTVRNVLESVDMALRLQPDRLAVFGYAHVPHMKSHQKLIRGSELPGAAERLDQAEAAAERLVAAGYVRIGLDHFARPNDDLAIAHAERRLHRNFQGYTTDTAASLIGIGASAISRLPQGYAQNAPDVNVWRKALGHGDLATARGVAFAGDDTLRAEAIERLMCDGELDVAGLCRARGRCFRDLETVIDRLGDLRDRGLIDWDGRKVVVTGRGKPLIRTICTAFDAYFDPMSGKHSKAI